MYSDNWQLLTQCWSNAKQDKIVIGNNALFSTHANFFFLVGSGWENGFSWRKERTVLESIWYIR